jgi:hypothetical protein
MKTFFIDLDVLFPETFKSLIGFVLKTGMNFRKIDLVTQNKTTQTLVVETATKGEETALKAFLEREGIATPITIGNANKANLGNKKLGIFSQVEDVSGLNSYYLDKSTGKKFTLISGV